MASASFQSCRFRLIQAKMRSMRHPIQLTPPTPAAKVEPMMRDKLFCCNLGFEDPAFPG